MGVIHIFFSHHQSLLITRDIAAESYDCKWSERGEKAESRWLRRMVGKQGFPVRRRLVVGWDKDLVLQAK